MSKTFLTTRITSLLVGAILITIVTVLGALFWMANEHNKKAAADSQTMIAGGVAAMQETLETVNKDYSWWEDAYTNIRAQNDELLYSNMGSGVTEADTADIMVIVQPDFSIRFAWQDGMEEEPDPAILDRAVVDQMIGLLADVPISEVEARVGLFDLGENIAMLAAARVVPDDLENLSAADLPVNIMGYFLTPERIAAIGEGFLIDDLTISKDHEEGRQWQALVGLDGEQVAHLHWTPQQPGNALLTRAALPIGIALAVFAFLGFAAAGRARNAAKKLADSEETASHAARSDSLSGLPNRLSFTERLASRAIQSAAENNELAVIFADVNGFKIVNDTVGHAGGDALIQQLADRLRNVLPKYAFLARVGGDEFNVLVTHRNAADAAHKTASQLLKALDEVFVVNGASFHVTAAAGYATSDDDDIAAEEVVRRADVAMYRAKEESAMAPIAYEPAFESGAAKKKQIEEALRAGMESGELTVFYQPIVDAGSHDMTGVEALLRWNSAELGPVSPVTFIPIAEEAGLIVDIGKFVLEQACADMASWPGLKVNVNVSPAQLRDPMFVENVIGIVELADINPKRIEIELTEGIVVSHPELARHKLEQLKAAGFTIALDDFGTGFSSIGYLRQLPFDKLKIDRCFVSDVGESDQANALLQSLVTLGDALDLKVVAEGVETADQAKLIHLLGCELLQGFYFAKPMPIAELRATFGEDKVVKMASVS
jgi:diguanylate cyclase (GGDEF)-like protein